MRKLEKVTIAVHENLWPPTSRQSWWALIARLIMHPPIQIQQSRKLRGLMTHPRIYQISPKPDNLRLTYWWLN